MNKVLLSGLLLIVTLSIAVIVLGGAPVSGAGKNNALKVRGAEFDPARGCDASAAWIRGIGMLFAPPGQSDKFAHGFLMHKLCATEFNAASFGLISGVSGEFLNTPGALGFDFKDVNAGFMAHCGAGAPRFNASMTDGFHFIGGCGNGTFTPSPRGTGWTQVRFDPQSGTQAFPPVDPSATILSLNLVFDEGGDSGDFDGSPEIVLDNIVVNGRMVVGP